MADVVTFGEGMLRLSPPAYERLERARSLEVWPAGAELNVAVGLARLGTSVTWVSRLPKNALGRAIEAHARANGVDTEHVRWDDEGRLGIFFLEVARAPRSSSALYDRAGSAFATLAPEEFDWATVLAGAEAFHVSGITPSLSDACAQATENALAAARAAGCRTSYDVNLRRRLTTAERALEQLERVSPYVDVVFCSVEDAEEMLSPASAADGDLADLVRETLGVPLVVLSGWAAGEREPFASPARERVRRREALGETRETLSTPYFEPVDPIGSGDAFCAGFLHALLAGRGTARALALGEAMASLKLSIPGDAPLVDREEVLALAEGAQARVAR